MPLLLKSVTFKCFSLAKSWFPIPNRGAIAVAEEAQHTHPLVPPTEIKILFHPLLTMRTVQLKLPSSGEVCAFFVVVSFLCNDLTFIAVIMPAEVKALALGKPPQAPSLPLWRSRESQC